MSGSKEQSLYFVSVPDQGRLCAVSLSLQVSPEDCRNQQITTCRELVLLYADILASPAVNSITDIWLIMAVAFYNKGIVQAYGHRHNLQLGAPRCVLPGILQCCLSYSLTTRLAPCWNKAGRYLLSGKEFLTTIGRLSAVSMELNATANQICIGVEPSTVRLPPTKLEDFGFPPMVLKNFSSQPDCVLHTSSVGACWCYVLPSMKRGRIMTISRQLPTDCPFKSYQDLQKHWHSLTVDEEVYCSVYFSMIGERLFTYPLSCIRLQPVHCCSRVNQQGALNTFISDLRARLQSICGLPVCMTSKPCYPTGSLTSTSSAQMLEGEPLNLTNRSSVHLVLTQLPAPAAPPVKPSFGLRLPERKEDVRVVEKGQGVVYGGNGPHSSGGERARSSASATTASSQSTSSSAPDPWSRSSPLGSPLALAATPPKLVFLSLTKLVQKLQNQRKEGAEVERRVTPANKTAAPAASSSYPQTATPYLASSSSSSSSSSPFVWSQRPPVVPPPVRLPSFTDRSQSGGVPGRRPEANRIAAPVPHNQPSPEVQLRAAGQRGDIKSGCETLRSPAVLSPPAPAVPLDVPSNKGVSPVRRLYSCKSSGAL
ncbi:hypothetical protein NHX12_021908 [Muraenolepis orangiensis]|uniref:DUF4708 domain-containing protein n=1 Tax=Muraenolepis orangiensis TaxID=630683 RepID=A0A9Q0ER37_9TELE|nr:hypothetical protein NHX12_021908 [Muraenolepis orangiensis]